MYSELKGGHKKKRYKGRLKQNLKKCDIDKETWKDLTRERVMWRALINKSNLYFEANRITKAKQKRDDHKEWQLNPARQNSWHEFLTCDVRAPMGLNSQMRVLSKWCTQPVFIGYDGQNKKNPKLCRLVSLPRIQYSLPHFSKVEFWANSICSVMSFDLHSFEDIDPCLLQRSSFYFTSWLKFLLLHILFKLSLTIVMIRLWSELESAH